MENKLFEFTLKVNLNFIFYQCNIVTYYYIWKNTSLVHISQSPSTVTNASSDIFLQISKRSDCSPLSSLIHFAQYLLTPVFKAEDLAFFISSYIITPHSSKLVITVNVCSMVYVQISDVAEQSGAPALFVCLSSNKLHQGSLLTRLLKEIVLGFPCSLLLGQVSSLDPHVFIFWLLGNFVIGK